jgi:ribosome-associated heat shock protein Hsp15
MSAPESHSGQRVDRWLWCARFFKSRTIAARTCVDGKVRLNRRIVAKASVQVRIGDVLTFAQGREIRVVRVAALAERRGPADEARLLYLELAETAAAVDAGSAAEREAGSGRPTKRERRDIERLRGRDA